VSSDRLSRDTPSAVPCAPVILGFGPNPWDGQWMNRQQLLSRLGRSCTVVYSTGSPQPGRRKGPRGGLRGSLVGKDNVLLDVPPTWLVRPTRFRWIRELAEAIAARRWRRLAESLGDGTFAVYVFHPKFWHEVKRLKPATLVYHAYDLYHLQGRGSYTFDQEERALVHAADLVIASSAPIAARLQAIGAKHVDVIENAADYDAFAFAHGVPPEVPVDIAAIPLPRIGYTGALNRKVDFPLLLELAKRLPACHFVLIGRLGDIDDAGLQAMERLRALANVHLVGFKDRTRLPAYMAAMDVNVMAYRLGSDVWTEGIYPLKLHEYLAAGQPVVSTDLPAVRPFADVIRIANDPGDWVVALLEALDGRAVGTQTTRRERARQNSWDERVRQLRVLLQRGRALTAAPNEGELRD
jgi:glycosyltransferase involved in cell wall biosynthesis